MAYSVAGSGHSIESRPFAVAGSGADDPRRRRQAPPIRGQVARTAAQFGAAVPAPITVRTVVPPVQRAVVVVEQPVPMAVPVYVAPAPAPRAAVVPLPVPVPVNDGPVFSVVKPSNSGSIAAIIIGIALAILGIAALEPVIFGLGFVFTVIGAASYNREASASPYVAI